MMRRKEVIFLLILVILSYTVSGVKDWGIVEATRPIFTLDFTVNETDTVNISNSELKNSTEDIIDYFKPYVLEDWNIFSFSPKTDKILKDGEDYTFTVNWFDDANNDDTETYTFTIKYPLLNITLIEPTLGVSAVTPFDFKIRTDKRATCKYSYLDRSYDEMVTNFSTDNNFLHEELGFTVTSTVTVYIKCKDVYDKVTPKSFELAFDSSKPDIRYIHADDATEDPIETTLIVRTNDETVCKYYMEDSTVSYGDMIPFSGYSETDENAYKTEHQQILGGNDLIDNQVNTVNVMCKNKAELLSNMEDTNINVDTSRAPLIIVHDPKRYINDTTPLFNVTTNKDTTCEIDDDSDMDLSQSMDGNDVKEHTTIISALTAGTYTYYVQCIFSEEGPQQTSVTFTIDDTPPNMTYVNILSPLENRTDKTYDDDELCAEWKGEDSESSISLYSYKVYWDKSSDQLIKEGTKSPSNDDEYCVDVDLNDSQKYFFEIRSQNGVGLWSDSMNSASIEVDLDLAPVRCNNDKIDGGETALNCGGPVCEGCSNGQACLLNRDCDSNYCNASSNTCARPRCDDTFNNGGESDVDCGGSCKKCDVGDFCNRNSDCNSGNCDSSTGKCSALLDSCKNERLDPDETDFDCGGSCPGCGEGKDCISDSDCNSITECVDTTCELKPIDTDGDGINDDVDNCPDVANEDQADVEGDGIGDACDPDSDNDGLPDTFEQQYFDCTTCVNPDDDPDKDGLTNIDEYAYNTNPTKRDTDGDSYSDKEEIDNGTDPLDPSSYPAGIFWKVILWIFILAILGAGGYYGYKVYGDKLFKKKPFVPPRAPPRGMPLRRPSTRRFMRPPVGGVPPGKLIRPGLIKRGIGSKAPTVIKKIEPIKGVLLPKKDESDVFKKLSGIAKTERIEGIEARMKSLNMTDKELKERINKLKKELNVK